MGLIDKCAPRIKSQGFGKLDSNAVAWFTRRTTGKKCNLLGFRYAQVANGFASFSSAYKDKPDEILCGLNKCDMTGVLTVEPSADARNTPLTGEETNPGVIKKTSVKTPIKAVGEKFQYGYTRFLIKGKAGDKFDIYLSNKGDQKNKSKYTRTLKEDGWNVLVFENFTPDEIIGKGWLGTEDAYELTVEPQQDKVFSLSTIELFENIYEMVRSQRFGVTCLNEFTPETELTTTEDVCDLPQYDETATTMELTLNYAKFIGDTFAFGGLTTRSDQAEHPVDKTDKFTTKVEVIDGVKYAYVTLPDLADVKCASFMVQPQDCAVDTLEYIDNEGAAGSLDLPDNMFFREGNRLYFSDSYRDTEMVINYPTLISAQAYEIGVDELNRNTYSLQIELPYGKNKSAYLQLDNVLVTGIPWTWTKEDAQLELPVTAVRDSEGHYGRWLIEDNIK